VRSLLKYKIVLKGIPSNRTRVDIKDVIRRVCGQTLLGLGLGQI